MKKLCLGLACLLALSAAHAEKADRDKPIQIDADNFNGNDLKQTAVYDGNVIVTQGTLRMTGARLDLREDPEGYRYAVLTAAPGQLVSFKQRRDPSKPGVEEWIDGQSERLEHDGKADTIRLVGRAKLRRLENEQPRDEMVGDTIVYNQRTAGYAVSGAPAGSKPSGTDGRVRTIIAPRSNEAVKGTPAQIAPSPQIAQPRRD